MLINKKTLWGGGNCLIRPLFLLPRFIDGCVLARRADKNFWEPRGWSVPSLSTTDSLGGKSPRAVSFLPHVSSACTTSRTVKERCHGTRSRSRIIVTRPRIRYTWRTRVPIGPVVNQAVDMLRSSVRLSVYVETKGLCESHGKLQCKMGSNFLLFRNDGNAAEKIYRPPTPASQHWWFAGRGFSRKTFTSPKQCHAIRGGGGGIIVHLSSRKTTLQWIIIVH